MILAGGHGVRFWPLSTRERPKQLLPLVTDRPMLRDTLDRLAPLAPPSRTLVLTSGGLAGPIRALAPELPEANVVAEPRPAGTAASLAWAAELIGARAGRDAVMVSVHADWAISDVEAFRRTLSTAAETAARERALVTVGIVPTWPNPGLGYIEPGDTVTGDVRRVKRFVEKPDVGRAGALVAGGALWNSGIFAWRAGDLLAEVAAHCPEVAPALAQHGAAADDFFSAVTPIAIDVGVLERSDRVMVLRGTFGWNDVGTWSALRDVRAVDGAGNAAHGPAFLYDTRGCVVHVDGTTAVLYGVEDLAVVALGDVTMVTTLARAADLKSLVESLPEELRGR